MVTEARARCVSKTRLNFIQAHASSRLRLLTCLLFVAMSMLFQPTLATPAESKRLSKESAAEAYRAALSDPFSEDALDRYLETLKSARTPESVLLYFFEGDIGLTREQVRAFLVQRKASSDLFEKNPEMTVNLVGGRPDIWSLASRSKLSYYIERKSFPTVEAYRIVAANMVQATRDWEQLCPSCGVKFEYRSDLDEAPERNKVVFVVRYWDTGEAVHATAFFPSDPPNRRYLSVQPSYFGAQYDQVGILRHELGHVLGYRHENTYKDRGCYVAEDGSLKRLSDYDPKSVMHGFCGDEATLALNFSQLDSDSHKNLYGPQQSPAASTSTPASRDLVVRFEGGLVARNVFTVAKILAQAGLVESHQVAVPAQSSVCQLYLASIQKGTRFDCPTSELTAFAEVLNSGPIPAPLAEGTRLNVPKNLSVTSYTYRGVYQDAEEGTSEYERAKVDLGRWNLKSSKKVGEVTYAQFSGYEIRIRVRDAGVASAVAKHIVSLNSANIYVDVGRPLSGGKLYGYGPLDYVASCRMGKKVPEEASYSEMLGLRQMPSCEVPCGSSTCPPSTIFLIDTDIAPNPDLTPALVKSGVRSTPSTRQTFPKGCAIETVAASSHHGTHMAGIMASQKNGYGFIGLSPNSQLESWNREAPDFSDSKLSDLIDEATAAENDGRKVFVFAGDLPEYEAGSVERGRLKREEARFEQHMTAKRIRTNQVLWITAAGQSKPNEDGVEIYPYSARPPMNLGDLPNVIVVTACENCDSADAKLMREANYSGSIVTLAAPGRDIPGWADRSSVTTMAGTSQATAFVGGVAAAMMGCGDDRRPVNIKKRLMLTATPSFNRTDYYKVQSGVINAELAMKDHRKNWLRTVGGTLQAVEILGWCSPQFELTHLFDDVEQKQSVETKKLQRLTRYGTTAPARYVAFQDGAIGSPLARSLPGRAPSNTPVLALKDSRVLRLGEIEELLLAKPIRQYAACSRQ